MKLKYWSVAWANTLLSLLLGMPLWCQQRGMNPQDYYLVQTVNSPQISPDGQFVAYVLNTIDEKRNERHSDIWVAYADGSREPRQLTSALQSSNSPRWAPNSKAIAFLSARPSFPEDKTAKRQVHILPLDGGEARALTNLKNGVESFRWSPDGTKLVCVSTWGPSDVAGENPNKSDTRHFTHSWYKSNSSGFLDDRRDHLWLVDVESGSAKQITEGDDWNDGSPQWSPDGKRILFVSNRSGNFWENSTSNSSEIWVVSADGGSPLKVTDGEGPTKVPQWSPDGKWIAYFAKKGDTDPCRLLLLPSTGGTKSKELANDLEISVSGLRWGDNGRSLYFLNEIRGEIHIFRVDVASGKLAQVTSGARFIHDIDINDQANSVAYVETAFQRPGDVNIARLDGTQEKQLTHLNRPLFNAVNPQSVERMSYKTADGFSVDGFLVKPAGWQEGKKYPMVLYIHGGPDDMFGVDWMILPQILTAHGWAVFYTNPRGSTGYGTKFMQGAVKEWGGKIYTDIITGVDAVLKQNAWIDANKLGVTGCSFGGYMTNWIISHTTRFKAAVPMCSISDYVSDEGTRDAFYGHAEHFGGDLYQNFDLYWKYSPVRYAMDVKTPTLILHGDADQRVPLEQAEQWFRALHHFHVPSEFVIFPHENHGGISGGQPRHVVEALRWHLYWFERYLDGNAAALPPDSPRTETRAASAVEPNLR